MEVPHRNSVTSRTCVLHTTEGEVELKAGIRLTVTHSTDDGDAYYATLDDGSAGWLRNDALSDSSARTTQRVQMLYNYDGSDVEGALTLLENDIMCVLEDRGDWLYGMCVTNSGEVSDTARTGIFPASYVTNLNVPVLNSFSDSASAPPAAESLPTTTAATVLEGPLPSAATAVEVPTLAWLCAQAFTEHAQMLQNLRSHCSRQLALFILQRLGADRRRRGEGIAKFQAEILDAKVQLADASAALATKSSIIHELEQKLADQQSKTARLENFVFLKGKSKKRET